MTDTLAEQLLHLPPVLRPKQVAELLGVCTQTVYARIADGSLPATMRRGRYYIRAAAVEAFLSGEQQPA